MIDVTEAKALVEKAVPGRDRAEADTLSAAAIDWAIKNLIGRTEARIRTYATYGKTAIAVKIAPGVKDREGIWLRRAIPRLPMPLLISSTAVNKHFSRLSKPLESSIPTMRAR